MKQFLGIKALTVVVALALGACTTGGPQEPQPTGVGALRVTVSGLPGGAQAAVTVSGPGGYVEPVAGSVTLAGLQPGSYTVAASPVTYQGVKYAGAVSLASVAVQANDEASTTVTYAPTSTEPGTLDVVITGLPVGIDADVEVSGPGLAESLTASTQLTDVTPGVYEATASTVTDGPDAYAPQVSGSPATVAAGGSATITVTYVHLDPAEVGALQVDIGGLPAGVDAAVTVTGVGIAFEEALIASDTLAGLVPGFYDVVAADVAVDGLTYRGLVDPARALVAPDATAAVEVTYVPVAPADGDFDSAPGLRAQFRNTGGAPVSLDGLPFNAAFTDHDVRGLQVSDVIGTYDDPVDYLRFRLVHGEGATTQVKVKLECETPGATPERAVVTDLAGGHYRTVLCGQEQTVTIPNDGGASTFKVAVTGVSGPYFTRYTLSVNAFCFQECQYVPAAP